MKTPTLLLILFTLTNINCISHQKTEMHKNISLETQKIEKIELTEQTRGTNRIITLYSGSIITSLNESVSKSELSSSEWESIVKQASLLDLSKISSYESPTTGRFSDRVLASTGYTNLASSKS